VIHGLKGMNGIMSANGTRLALFLSTLNGRAVLLPSNVNRRAALRKGAQGRLVGRRSIYDDRRFAHPPAGSQSVTDTAP
jgi:hypothetical protein